MSRPTPATCRASSAIASTWSIRFGDTDAMGHANNARFLTYCESARIDYWETVTGESFGLATHGESGVDDPGRDPGHLPIARVLRRAR